MDKAIDKNIEKSIKKLEFDIIREMLADCCASPMAKDMARNLMPSTDIEEIRTLQSHTAEALELLIAHGSISLGNFHDISDSLHLADIGSTLTPKRLLEVSDNMRSAANVKGYLMGKASEEGHVGRLAAMLATHKTLEAKIENAILGENEISDNASSALRSIRKRIENKKNEIRDRLNQMVVSPQLGRYLQDSIVTIRNDRFVLPVKSEYRSSVSGMVHDQSAKGGTVYIEPMAVVNLNNELATLGMEEAEEIRRILEELTADVAGVSPSLRQNASVLTELDFIVAKGKLALKQDATEPEINSDKYIKIRAGRHPMIPKDVVVPLNLWMGKDFNILLITGPNTGGKTVSLKTTGLFALMAQSGLHLPADHGTSMPVLEAVYADIGDEQSIAQSLSTFSAHMTNIVEILNEASENSLVLLDELGAGTDPTEGAALAVSILENLRKRGGLTIATTHYAELKQYALVTDGVENASVEFDVATLSPTYRLLVGVPGKSNAFEISKKLGLSGGIIEDARSRLMTQSVDFERVLAKIQESHASAEKELDEAVRLRLDAQKLRKRYEESEARSKDSREKILSDAKKEARAILRKAKEEADAAIKDIKNIGSKESLSSLEDRRRRLREGIDSMSESVFDFDAVDEDGGADDHKITEGAHVRFLPLNKDAVVLTDPNDKGECQIAIGSMKMVAVLSQLEFISRSAPKPKQQRKTTFYEMKSKNVRPEIDVRGMNVDDAIMEISKYIDEVVSSSLGKARIIHGKGTGALKKGLIEYFRTHPNIAKFEDAAPNEGGGGATNITLK